MGRPSTLLVVFLFVVLSSLTVVVGECTDNTKLFHVNCSVSEGSNLNNSVDVSSTKDRCGQVSVNMASLVSTIWLCSTKVCDSCLFVQRSTEVGEDDADSKGKNSVQNGDLGQQVQGGYLPGLYTISVNYWNNGAKSTLWLSNLFTPSFSETFIPLPSHNENDSITVDGVDEEGKFPVTYATCTIVRPQLPCQPDRTTNITFTSPVVHDSSVSSASPSASRESPILSSPTSVPITGHSPESEDETSSIPSGFIAAIVVLGVVLILVAVILVVLLFQRRNLLTKCEDSTNILNSAFPRSGSREEMVAASPKIQRTSSVISSFNRTVSVTSTGPFITEPEDTESGLSSAPASASQSGNINQTFYIEVMGPEEGPKTPEVVGVAGEGSQLHRGIIATYDALGSSATDVAHCHVQLHGNKKIDHNKSAS